LAGLRCLLILGQSPFGSQWDGTSGCSAHPSAEGRAVDGRGNIWDRIYNIWDRI